MLVLPLLALSGAAIVSAENNVPPPPLVPLSTTKSAVIPVAPTPFPALLTNQGAITNKANSTPAGYTGVNGPAVVQDNEAAAVYTASLPAVAFNALTGTTIRGSVVASTNAGQTGVTITVSLTDLPDLAKYGPFGYHIHNAPVPADGNCTSTLAHFDPQNVGEYYPCVNSTAQNCQAGDLAGKHGKITSSPSWSASYVDNYLSLKSDSPYSLVGRSIVIHTSNTTRLTCANFVQGVSNATMGTNATATNPVTTATPTSYTASANRLVAGAAAVAVAAGLAAALM